MGAPAFRPKAKKALMMPAKMATERPLRRLKSRSPDSILSAGVSSRSLERAGEAVDGDGDEAEEDAEEDDLAGAVAGDGGDFAGVDGRNEGAEGGAEAERDGVAEGDAEIADGEAEGEAAESPERAEEDGVADGGAGRVGEDLPEVRDEDGGDEGGGEDPGGEALDDPVDLPAPALDAAERDEVCGGGEAADPVVDNADEGVGSHEALVLR